MSWTPGRVERTLIEDFLILAGLAVLITALAFHLWMEYAANPASLWRGFYHDRNGHFSFGLDLALAARDFDFGRYLVELSKAKVWPPVHGIVLSLVLLAGSIDVRLAIVPSLIGWALTIALSALIARRLFDDRVPGFVAAGFAVAFAAGSPAFRLLGSDVMLEALGAALSALALLLYLQVQNDPQRTGPARALALVLTALFFEKYNYWGMLAASLAVSAMLSADRTRLIRLWTSFATIDIKSAVRVMARDPLLLAFAATLGLVVFLYWQGPAQIVLFNRPISLYPPQNLSTVAYALLFVRMALTLRRHRAAIDAALGPAGRAILYFHVAPIAVSFLVPQRLSAFVWFVGPANAQTSFDVIGGATFYWHEFANGFHADAWMALVVAVLAIVGAIGCRRLRPGASAVFVFVALSAAAVVVHPQHQGRFLASWIFATWIAAGAGVGLMIATLLRGHLRLARPIAAVAVVVAVGWANIWRAPSAAANATAIRRVDLPSDLDLLRPVLAELNGIRRIGIATTFGTSPLFHWVLSVQCRCRVEIEEPWIVDAQTQEQAQRLMAASIARAVSEYFVIIDAPHGPYSIPYLHWTYDVLAGQVDAMRQQDRYALKATYPVASHGAEVMLWQRRPGS